MAQSAQPTVPVEFFRGLPLVQVSVNRAPAAWFLLDTASSWNVLDRGTADALGIKTEGSQKIRGGGDNTAAITFASGVTLTVGGVTRSDDHLAVMRLPFKYDRPIAGMLGGPFLTQFVVTLDYRAATLTLAPPDAAVSTDGASVIPFRLEAGIPTIDAAIARPDGTHARGAFHIDTGASQTVILNRPFAIANGFMKEDADETGAVRAGSLTGGSSYLKSTTTSLTLGTIVVRDPVVNLSLDRKGSGSQSGRTGLIGDGILSSYVMTLDYPRSRLILR